LREGSTDRKELARQLHSEVLRLKESPAAQHPQALTDFSMRSRFSP